jgi:hypothetical protein
MILNICPATGGFKTNPINKKGLPERAAFFCPYPLKGDFVQHKGSILLYK